MSPQPGEIWVRRRLGARQRAVPYLIIAVALHVYRFDGETAEQLVIFRDADYEPAKTWAQPLWMFEQAFERLPVPALPEAPR